MTGPVLVTGASGFVGRAAVRALAAAEPRVPLRLLVHRRAPELSPGSAVEHVAGDLTASATLDGVCAGVRTVLHLASHVGADPTECDAVNAGGTAALVSGARRAGVERIIYLSTAAVYGWAVHRGASEAEVRVAPATPVSRSRALAERSVLDAGGVVVRPLFVYGDGDTRFVPTLVRAARRLGFLVRGGRARISVIAVDDLAGVLRDLALLPADASAGGAYHVTDGHPVHVRDLLAALGAALDVTVPTRSVPYPVARLALALAGRRTVSAADRASAAHRLFLVSRDHVYSDTRLRTLLGPRPCRPATERIGEFAGWYRRALTTAA